MFSNPKGFCIPTVIYMALGLLTIVGTLFADRRTVMRSGMTKGSLVLSNTIGILIMSMIFYLLCVNGYETIAWVLLLFPLIFGLIIVIVLFATLGTAIGTATVRSKQRVEYEPRERVVVRRTYE